MVIRIIHGVELLPPVASEEFVIGNTRSLVNLVCELTFLNGYFQAVVGISGRLVRHHPKHLDHVENTHRRGIRVHAVFVHFHTARSGSKMSAFVPFFPGGSVCRFQFGQSVKFILVRLDTLQVRAARVFLGGDILAGEPPILVQNLCLKTSENALYRFGLPAVWSRGSMNMADNLIKEMAILQLLWPP